MSLNLTPREAKVLRFREAMLRSNGNMSLAAARLGVSRPTVWRILQADEARVEGEMHAKEVNNVARPV